MTADNTGRWMVSWSASTSGSQGAASGPESTVRQTMRLSAGGRSIRLRFANPHTYSPLRFDAATVGLTGTLPASVIGTPLPVTVEGGVCFTVQPGAVVLTDPVPLAVPDLATITVSCHSTEPVELSKHDWSNRLLFSTLASAGDHTADASGAAFRPFGFCWVWVDAVDVLDPNASGAIVALGDSITDGAGSDFGTDTRWPDRLAERLLRLPPGDPRRRTVANAGIGGNTVGGLGTDLVGANALSRLERDVLSQAGVTEVIVFEGSNDLYLGGSVEQLTADFITLAGRIRAHGARPLIATMVPRMGGYQWNADHERRRQRTNAWIRGQAAFDAVLDFDAALANPAAPDRLRPDLDADGTHPNSAGYRAIAESVELNLFRTGGTDAPSD